MQQHEGGGDVVTSWVSYAEIRSGQGRGRAEPGP